MTDQPETAIVAPAADAPAPAAPPPLPRNPWRRVVPILVGLVAIGAGYGYFRHQDSTPVAQAQAAAAPPPPVTVASPLVKNIVEWDEFTGQFAAVDEVDIRARVSGFLQSIHFRDGQLVNQGDLLFVIDPRPFQIALTAAQSSLASAQARLDLAKLQLSRAEKLKQSDFTSQSTLDQRQQEMLSAAADTQVATAAINAAKLNLEFTQVTAPVTGRISAHRVSVGNLVTGGESGNTTLLTTIVSLDPIHFDFDMSEADFLAYQRAAAAGRLKSNRDSGIVVSAHLMDETDWRLQGTLDFVDNAVDRTAGTIRARAVFPNSAQLITPGQFGRIRIPGSDPYDAVLIPDSAILSDQSRKIVMTVDAEGSVTPKVIRPGPMIDGLRIVRDGLSGSDVIIIDGLLRARPGGKVMPQPGQIEAPAGN
jgi:RND family efflux transporter MFP subunit